MRTFRWKVALTVTTLLLLLVACSIEEDLRINSDGSGSYRVKVSIPKDLGEGFGDFRKEAEKNGFVVEQEGQTESERFLVIRKTFTDIAALNDDTNHFELTVSDAGVLRRQYRLHVWLKAIGFGGYKRHFVVTMPGHVQSTTAGTAEGDRVTWEGSEGVALDIVAEGFAFPVTRNQKLLIAALVLLLAVIVARRRQRVITPISQA